CALLFLLIITTPPTPTLFPYTTLFRSGKTGQDREDRIAREPDRRGRQRRPLHPRPAGHRRAAQRAIHPVRPPIEPVRDRAATHRSEEHTSELQSRENLVCRLLLEKKND